MLEYILDLMDDGQDFGWNSAKASHVVLLGHMEEGNVAWQDATKIDHIRRTHAHRSLTNQPNGSSLHKKLLCKSL